jgi:O-antigen ligase
MAIAVVVSAVALIYPPTCVVALVVLFSTVPFVLYTQSPVAMPQAVFLLVMAINAVVLFSNFRPYRSEREIYVPRWTIVLYTIFLGGVILGNLLHVEGSELDLPEFACYCFGLLTAFQLRTRNELGIAMGGLMASSAIFAIWLQSVGGRSGILIGVGLEEGVGQIYDPNYFGCYMGFGLVALYGFVIDGPVLRHLVWRLGGGALLAFLAFALLQTASRGMFLSALVAMAIMTLRRYWRPWQLIPIAAIIFIVAPSLYKSSAFDALAARFSESNLSSGGSRFEIFDQAMQVASTSDAISAVFGRGTGGGMSALSFSTHNAYLTLLLDYGILGIATIGGISLTALWRLLRAKEPWAYSQLGVLMFLLLSCMSLEPIHFATSWVAFGVALPAALGAKRSAGQNFQTE